MALVLTGCGPDDDGAAASPSSPASAGVAAEETGGGSPPPSSTSGPADASAEYVPASLDGPAQNVPKPVMPELAREESREGAQAFLDYWSDAMWYAYQTGDTSYARDIISPHCEACLTELSDVASVYKSGSWMIGGRPEIAIQENLIVRAQDGAYKPRGIYSSEGGKLVEDGMVRQEAVPDSGNSTLVYMDFVEGEWIYITMAPTTGE
ncbi:DUF6318 family protein [Kocuria oceani]|uniref:DUF6318 family protein n=1 Tax=Kocuria oceani TaxID=988827 RepID=UPI004036536E